VPAGEAQGDEKAARVSRAIDRFSARTGNAVAWLTLGMVLVTFLIVILRYVFNAGLIWLQETVIWMHAVVFMLGAASTLQRDEHVRVDIFYRRLDNRRRAWVDLAGVIVFLLPLCGFLLYTSWDYVAASWMLREGSRDAGGLPYPFVPLLKTMLLIMPLAVALQGLSLLLASLARIRGR
jgi:TRAP-type mannitol/chloroaromatic compound transport system permease small subunit